MNPEISSGLSGGSEEDDPFACSNFTKDAQSPQLDQIQTNRSSFLPTGIDWKSEISLCERVTQAVFCFTQMCYSLPTVSQFLHEAQYYPRDDLSAKLEALALDLESQTSRALAHVCPSYSQHRISESYETRNISELGDTLYARYAGVPNVLRLVASEICKPDAPPIDSLIRHIESAIVSSIETTARNVAAALDDIASAQSLSSLAIPELVRSFPRAPTSVSAGLHTTDGGFIERYELAPPIEYVTVAMFIDTVDSLQGGLQQIEDYLAHEGSSPFGGFVDRAIQDLSAKFDLSNVDHLLQAALRKGNLSSYSLGEIDPRIEKRLLTLEISRLPIEQRQHIDIARCFFLPVPGLLFSKTLGDSKIRARVRAGKMPELDATELDARTREHEQKKEQQHNLGLSRPRFRG